MSNNNNNEAINFEAFIKVIDIFKNNKTEKQYKFMYELFDLIKMAKYQVRICLLISNYF